MNGSTTNDNEPRTSSEGSSLAGALNGGDEDNRCHSDTLGMEVSLKITSDADRTDSYKDTKEDAVADCTYSLSNYLSTMSIAKIPVEHSELVTPESFNCEPEDTSADTLTLDKLPSEIFLHICSFLDIKFMISTVARVCKLFHTLLNDKMFWKIRLKKRWNKKYPVIPVNDNEFNWIEACYEREKQYKIWSNPKENTNYFKFTEGLYAPVDTVHFMEDGCFLAAGSRDRYLNVLDLRKLNSEDTQSVKNCRSFCKMDAHKGWIWSMSSLDSVLATGSWDRYIKFWDLAAGGSELRRVRCNSAVLCTHFEAGYMVAGCYDKKVYHIDPRSAVLQEQKRYHKQPVLCMAVDEKYIITGSEDKTVVVFDRRADSVYKTITLEQFPLSLSYGHDQLWVGDKMGALHLFDATDGDFNIVDSYEGVHQRKITGVIHGLGSIFTCSTDKTIKVLEPTLNPDVITTLTNHTSDIAKIAFHNDILACASSDVSIGIWTPRLPDTH